MAAEFWDERGVTGNFELEGFFVLASEVVEAVDDFFGLFFCFGDGFGGELEGREAAEGWIF